MASDVEVCNLALSNIRAGSINSLTEASLQAQQCKLKYPFIRDRVLGEIPWSFNRKIAPLQLLTTEIFNWAYAYKYPVDCLRINRLVGSYEELTGTTGGLASRMADPQLLSLNDTRRRIEYEIFNFSDVKTIGANEPDLRIEYSAKVTDVNLFSVDCIMAMSHLLSAELAIPIVGAELGRNLRNESLQLYKTYLDAALANDANEQYLTPGLSEYELIRR